MPYFDIRITQFIAIFMRVLHLFLHIFSTVTSTSTSTSTKAPETSTTAIPMTSTPEPRHGSQFDGWSFFGGILLTIGLSAIGFVSFKYYKVRSGGGIGGASYNRF